MTPKSFSHNDTTVTTPAAVIVTPYSTGCCMALEIQRRGYSLICLWSRGFSEVMKTHVPASCAELSYDLEFDEQDTLEQTASLVLTEADRRNLNIVACICGGEAGVDLADALSETLGLLTNGTAVPNRRDKKVQQELIKASGLRSVRQAAGRTFAEVKHFLQTESYPVIVKPLDSAGSDGVKLCHSYQEAKEHFHSLTNGHELVNGGECHEALCQEFLKGKEYVVDHVSRDGVHKVMMVWEYDKRAVNGASFVYFGDIPLDSSQPEARVLIPYVQGVLDAMQVKNGPSHAEVIITQDGTPCLVEMNCRAHGGDGIWLPLCRALTGGYNQVDAAVDAYLDQEKFDLLPETPPSPFLTAGQCVDLVCFTSGTVKSTPGYSILKQLPSFVCLETHVRPGTKVVPTVDMATDLGTCVLMHPNKDVLQRDIAFLRQMEKENALFELYDNKRPVKQHKPRSCSLDYAALSYPVNENNRRSHRRILSVDPPEMYLLCDE